MEWKKEPDGKGGETEKRQRGGKYVRENTE
jgi:hypothetical protein